MRLPDRYVFIKKNIAEEKRDLLCEEHAFKNTVFSDFEFYYSDLRKFHYHETEKAHVLGYGIFIDPKSFLTSEQIVFNLALSSSFKSLLEKLAKLGGRWVVLAKFDGNIFVVGDASNTKQIFYTTSTSESVVASYEYSIANLLNLNKSAEASKFYEEYVKITNWWPGDSTIFDEVKNLLPNHYLDFSTNKPHRFYPNTALEKISYDEAQKACGKILRGFFCSLVSKYKVALPVTSGVDSRLLLAASFPWRERIFYFVSAHDAGGINHPDVKTSVKLFKKLGVKFSVLMNTYELNIKLLSKLKKMFPEIHESAVKYFFKSVSNWPTEVDIVLEGPINEVGSRYYKNRIFKVDPKSLCNLAGMQHKFAEVEFEKWLLEALPVTEKTGYDILDLFYWEHRTGRWVGKISNELETAFDPLFAYNLREYLDVCLRVKSSRKNFPDRLFFKDLISLLQPECRAIPFGPHSSILGCISAFFRRTWLEKYLRVFFYFLRSKFPSIRGKAY